MKHRSLFKVEHFLKNQYVELVVFDPEQGRMILKSRVISCDKDQISLHWPQSNVGTKYFFRDVTYGILQGLVDTKIISFKVNIPISVIRDFDSGVLQVKSPVIVDGVFQNRDHTRVNKQVDLKFRALQNNAFSDELSEGLTSDISTGGMEFTSQEEVDPGTTLELFFTLNYFDLKGVLGTIIRVEPTTLNDNLTYVYALRFTTMFERDRIGLNQILLQDQPDLLDSKIS
ncbi:MAG: PilZ domain-containing protein [Candidatus Cloacimonetes bacterium]|nr:PilZ domain-containing protein [Candidatus Cloacimonadota bacterium]